MKFLVDKNTSFRLCRLLDDAGHEAKHVDDVGLGAALDDEILEFAAVDGSVIISSDTDFGTLLAFRRARTPSVILTREISTMAVPLLARLLLANLPSIAEALVEGAVVAIGPGGVRVRRLPLR